MLHFIQSDSKVSFNFILALRRYRKRFTHLHLHWFHTATLHEICCPGLSSRSEMVLFLFICCAYAWDFFLAIFLEGFAGALPFEFLLYFHILYLRHMPLEPMGFNTLIAHSKSHPLKMDFAPSLQPSTSLLVLSALFNPSGHLISSLGPSTSGSETSLVNHVVPVQIFMQSIPVCFNGHSFNVMLQTLCLQLAMCLLGLAAFAIKQVATRRGEMR